MSEKSPKSVLITGSNRGIGYGLVIEFLKNAEVDHVFAGVRDPCSATKLHEVRDNRLKIVKLDVTCDDSIKQVVDQISLIVGDQGLNLLINNAAILTPYWLTERPNRENLIKMHNVNVVSPVIVSHVSLADCSRSMKLTKNSRDFRDIYHEELQYFLPLLRKATRPGEMNISKAAILNISSELGSNVACPEPGSGRLGFIPYKSSKAALNRFTSTLQEDLKEEGILVVAFHPGWVQTDMGGPLAPTSLEESTGNLVATFSRLNERHAGGFFDNRGNCIQY